MFATPAGDVMELQLGAVAAWEAGRRTDGALEGARASLMGGAALCVETVAYKADTSSTCREMFACM